MHKSKKINKGRSKPEEVPQRGRIRKDIVIEFDSFREVYESVDVTECVTEQTIHLNIKKLVKLLEKTYNIVFLNKQVKFFLQQGSVWLLCPKGRMSISQDDFMPNQQIRLQVLTSKEYIDAIMEQSDSESESDNPSEEEWEAESKCRRLKQRKIKHVIEKVLKWRELYAGQGDTDEKVPLEEGARMVNISKKTLDDYLSQIKKGCRLGFNFNQHKNEKIGILREFIRKAEKTRRDR